MIGQRSWRGRLPVALTAVAAAVGTVLAGGAAQAAEPAPAGAAGDFAQDGRAAQQRITKLRGQTAATTKAAAPTDELTFGDIDGDGKADLAAIDSAGRLWIYPGKATVYSGTGARPTSHFAARFQAGSGWGNFTKIVRHGDWNNDGKQDLLARDSAGRLFLYAGTGTRPGIVRNGVQVGSGWNGFLDLVGVGDVNGDGFDDLMGRKDGVLITYFGTGNSTAPFRKTVSIGGSGWNGSLLTTVGDWDGDGRSEFFFRNTRSEVYLYWSSANGFPSNDRALIFEAEGGAFVRNMVGMGNLTSDATVGGQPVVQPLPDLIVQDTGGYLLALAVDTEDDFDPVVGFGWNGYRLF
jgi:hypothetical protein